MQDKDTKKIWSLGLSPCPDENDYYITYGLGYAKYQHQSNEIAQTLNMYIPMEDNLKVQVLKLENHGLKKKRIKLIYYIKPVLEEDEIKSNGYCNLEFVPNSNIVCIKTQEWKIPFLIICLYHAVKNKIIYRKQTKLYRKWKYY